MEGKIALCIALLAAVSLAAPVYVGGEDAVCYADLVGRADWIAMAMVLTITIIALAYMFAKATENENLSVWAHDEMFSFGIALLVIAGAVAFTVGSCVVLSSYSSNPQFAGVRASPSPFAVSYAYLDALAAGGISIIERQTADGLRKQMDAVEYLYIGIPVIDSKGVPVKASLKALASHKEMAIDIMLPLVVSLKAQKGALQTIEIMGLAVMLPFAIILRIIPFTRSAGNLMLAAVFAIYVAVPAVYVLSAGAWNEIGSQGGADMRTDFSFKDRALGDACTGSDCPLYQISSLIPQAIFLPNFAIVVGTTCVMALSRALAALGG